MKIYGHQKEVVMNLIKEFVLNARNTPTAREVADHINSSLNRTYSVQTIRALMKNELKLSFKRVKSRSNNIDLKKINSVRNLFAIKFSKVITDDTLVINIDEVSINKDTKINYSWGLKGKDIEVWNSSFIGSVNIIAAIWSNGAWMSMILNQTIDSTNLHGFWRLYANGSNHIIVSNINKLLYFCITYPFIKVV